MTNTAVFGVLKDDSQEEAGVRALLDAGFRREEISVLLAEKIATQGLPTENHTKAPEGVATGAGTGAVIGGTLGLLLGMGALAIPGLGAFIAAGPVLAALSGAGWVGAAGGIVGGLIGLGIPEKEAQLYESLIKEGRTLISVHCDNAEDVARAEEVLKQIGADDVSATGESGMDLVAGDGPQVRSGGAG